MAYGGGVFAISYPLAKALDKMQDRNRGPTHQITRCPLANMFTNNQRQEERTGKYGTPRVQYLQELVTQFQNASNEESKEKIVANLANFAYDPFNYTFLRQLNVLELFLDCITEPNERLVEFGIGGICNSCADPANAAVVTQCGGIPLVIQCLSSPVRNTVNYALGALYYLCNELNKEDILKPEVVDVIKRYAASAISVSFSNLAHAFLDKHVQTEDHVSLRKDIEPNEETHTGGNDSYMELDTYPEETNIRS
ncbi:armadillo repeat-containing protein 7-like [Forsythia ovata]|uniref:Armadillo repeat-containing protein 7-like n=1 Tax=Forsythia ovata TaxID=205694 RepID=A0ABD1USB5_9LAMI